MSLEDEVSRLKRELERRTTFEQRQMLYQNAQRPFSALRQDDRRGSVKREQVEPEESKPFAARVEVITLSDDEDNGDVIKGKGKEQFQNLEKRVEVCNKTVNDLKNAFFDFMGKQGSPSSSNTPSTSNTNTDEISNLQFIEQFLEYKKEHDRRNSSILSAPTPPKNTNSPRNVDVSRVEPGRSSVGYSRVSEQRTSVNRHFQQFPSSSSQGPSTPQIKRKATETFETPPRKSTKVGDGLILAGCSLCPAFFREIPHLLNHRLQTHGRDAMLQCGICNAKFPSVDDIARHLADEFGDFECSICSKTFATSESAAFHESFCIQKKQKLQFECFSCDKSFAEIDELLDHRQNSHGINMMLKCGKCSESFLSRLKMKRHLNIEYKLFPCKTCDASLESQEEKEEHEQICHQVSQREPMNEVEPIVLDDDVDSMITLPSPIENVQRDQKFKVTHNPPFERSHFNLLEALVNSSTPSDHSSPVSIRSSTSTPTKRKADLPANVFKSLKQNHTVSASHNHGMITCRDCNISISTIKEWLDHKRSVHGERSMLICEKCGEMFNSREDIEKHLNIEYGIFGCIYCDQKAKDKSSMELHDKLCKSKPGTRLDMKNDQVFTCKSCEKTTMSEEIWKNHENVCGGFVKPIINCSICKEVFDNVPKLLTHRKDFHGGDAMLECGICGKLYSRRDCILHHLNTEYQLYPCLKCWKCFPLQSLVYQHERNCNHRKQCEKLTSERTRLSGGEGGNLLKCSKCNRTTGNSEILAKHALECNGEEWPTFKCNICGVSKTDLCEYLTHRHSEHGSEAMLTCYICNHKVETRKSIRYHLTQELGLIKCLNCYRGFPSVAKLLAHEENCFKNQDERLDNQKPAPQKNYHAASRLIYQCLKCNRRSGIMKIYEDHEATCIEEAKIIELPCTHCDKKFTSVNEYQSHRIGEHGEEAASKCGVCNRVFDSVNGISRHLYVEYALLPCLKCGMPQKSAPALLEHEINCVKSEGVPINCLKCNKVSFNQDIMDEHELLCDEENIQPDIQCVLCYEKFIDIPSLLGHVAQNHSEEAMLTCGICGRKFTSKTGVMQHLNIEYKLFPCLKCGKGQTQLQRLMEHEKSCAADISFDSRNNSNDSYSSVFQCSKCLKIGFFTSFNKNRFNSHEEDCTGAKNEEATDISCKICNESYFATSDLATHQERVHDKKNNYECTICYKKFDTKPGYVRHLNIEYNIFPCSKCGKRQYSDNRRIEHEKACNEQILIFEQCKKCSKFGHKKNDMEQHEERCEGDMSDDNDKVISCAHCSDTFINVPSLVAHILNKHGEKTMLTCGLCGKTFDSRQGVLMHYLLEYSKHICRKCEKPFINAFKLAEHEESCNVMKVLTCEKCKKETFNEEFLTNHIEKCEGGKTSEPEVFCSSCNIKYLSVNDFLIHRSQVHGSEGGMLKCFSCGKKFTSKSGIIWHYNLEFCLYPCTKCGKACRSGQNLIEHEVKCTGVSDMNQTIDADCQKCEKCNLQSYKSDVLLHHINKCQGKLPDIVEKIITCNTCNAQFLTISDLYAHRNKEHSESLALKCGFCEKKFGSKNGIIGHLRCEYGLNECSKCGSYFQTHSLLKEHTGKGCTLKYEEELMKCKTCGNGSYIKSVIQSHEECCKNVEIPFKCSVCEVTMLSTEDLVQHRLREHGEKEALTCVKCGKRFASLTGINWHMNKEYVVYECKHCKKPQPSFNLLSQHEISCGFEKQEKRIVMRDSVLNCSKCGIGSYYEESFAEHEEKCDGTPRLTEGGKEIYCTVCNGKYLSVNELATHRQKEHGDEIMLECGICDKKYETKSGVQTHYNLEFVVYPCSKCGAPQNSAKRRKDHEKSCKNEEKPKVEEKLNEMIKCNTCEKWTYLKSAMEEHMMKCEDEDESSEDMTCSICSVNCLLLDDLLIHRQSQHGQKEMLTCGVCSKVYDSKSGLKPHLALEYKLYKCKFCDKCMSSQKLFDEHVRDCLLNDTVLDPTTKEEELKCSKCGKLSIDSIKMEKHELECDENVSLSKPMECSVCKLVYISVSDLLFHRKYFHGKNVMLACGGCDRRFSTRDQIYKHIVYEYEVHKCGTCGWVGRGSRDLLNHREKCKDEPQYLTNGGNGQNLDVLTCSKCDKITFSGPFFAKHEDQCKGKDENYDDVRKTFTCNHCSLKCMSIADMLTHKHKEHGYESSQECNFCDDKFIARAGMTLHLNIEYGLFKCSKCGRPCASEKRLENHELSCNTKRKSMALKSLEKPLNEDGSVSCEKCDRRAFNKNYVGEHQSTCSGTEKDSPNIECTLCDAKYLTIADFLSHRQKAHGNDVMLTCPICQRKTNQRTAILLHLTMEYRLFECDSCHKCFEDRNKLDEHKIRCARKHKKQAEVEEKPFDGWFSRKTPETVGDASYFCTTCKRKTFDTFTLNEHMLICGRQQSGIPIDCWTCGEKMISINDLVRHRGAIHGEEQMLECNFCGKKANSKGRILGHLTMEFQVFKCYKCDRCFDCAKRLDEHLKICDE